MKQLMLVLFALATVAPSVGAELSTAARTAIPSSTRQILTVDYRALRDSHVGMELGDRFLPGAVKEFQVFLAANGVEKKSIDRICFVTYAVQNGEADVVIVQGTFSESNVVSRLARNHIVPKKYALVDLYFLGGMQMAFLDPSTIVFGDEDAVKGSLDVHNGEAESIEPSMYDLVLLVQNDPIWSVLDVTGTRTMLASAFGSATAKVPGYESVANWVRGSYYAVDFPNDGLSLTMSVQASNVFTAATMSQLTGTAFLIYDKTAATSDEKIVLDHAKVGADGNTLALQFQVDGSQFGKLLKSKFFNRITH